jgi:hypothetical protein
MPQCACSKHTHYTSTLYICYNVYSLLRVLTVPAVAPKCHAIYTSFALDQQVHQHSYSSHVHHQLVHRMHRLPSVISAALVLPIVRNSFGFSCSSSRVATVVEVSCCSSAPA